MDCTCLYLIKYSPIFYTYVRVTTQNIGLNLITHLIDLTFYSTVVINILHYKYLDESQIL